MSSGLYKSKNHGKIYKTYSVSKYANHSVENF